MGNPIKHAATAPEGNDSSGRSVPKPPRRFWRAAIKYGFVYGLVVILLTACANKLLLFPSTEPIPGVGGERFDVAGPQGAIEIWKKRAPGAPKGEPIAFVMTFIGNASRAEYDVDPVAQQWGKRPVEVWAVNYPGFGKSAGGAKLGSIAPAALAAYDEMKKVAGGRPTFVAGRSIGTTAALYVAAHRPVNGVILHSPPPLRNLIMGRYGWWNLWLAAIPVALSVPADLDSIDNAGHVTVPGVFLITDSDGTVPPAFQQKVVDAYGGPKQIIHMPDTDHNDEIPESALRSLHESMEWLLPQASYLPK